MPKGKFQLDTLTADADTVARLVPAGELFRWMSRSIVVPAGWVALATHAEKDAQITQAGRRLEEDDSVDVLFVRATPNTCAMEAADLQSADAYPCRGSIRLHVGVAQELAELAAFRRTVVGSNQSVSVADLQRYLHWQMHKVLTELASRYSAAELIEPLDAAVLRNVADEQLGPVCLAGGLNIAGAVAVHFESPAYLDHHRHKADLDRRRQRAAARSQIQDMLATAQNERLTHLVGLLEQLHDVSETRGDLSVVDLLKTFNETDRGQLYSAFWHLSPRSRETRYVAAVSGQEVLYFDPTDIERAARRVVLPDTLGRLRSIAVDTQSLAAGVLMVGAATGVHLVEIDSDDVQQSLPAGVENPRNVRGGVNAVAMSDDRVFASHSELGLMVWPRGDTDPQPARRLLADLTANENTVRCVQVAGNAVWFAADEKLWTFLLADIDVSQPVLYPGSHTTLSAVAVFEGHVYAGNVDGQILAWDVDDPESVQVIRGPTGSPVESIDVVDAGGVDRVIVADRSNALMALVAGDNYACRYESGTVPIRRAAAAEDVFVAMNDNRDRLIVWNPRTADEPTGTVVVPHITGNHIQDLCLIPNRPSHE